MPREAKSTPAAESTAPAAPAEQPKLTKTEQVRQALNAHPGKMPKELAELLQAEGMVVSAAFISQTKTKLGGAKKKQKAARAPTVVAEAAAPAVPKDAVSIALLQKAKKLAAQFGSIKEAKQAIDAFAQLMD
jgi:arginine repressor